jgi:hypothetical protein
MKMTCLDMNHVTHKEKGLSSKFQSRFNMKQQPSSHRIVRVQPSSWLYYLIHHFLQNSRTFPSISHPCRRHGFSSKIQKEGSKFSSCSRRSLSLADPFTRQHPKNQASSRIYENN